MASLSVFTALATTALATPRVTLAAGTTQSAFPGPTVNVSCMGGIPRADLSWVNPVNLPVFFVDISPDSSFSPLYHKNVRGFASTVAPAGFDNLDGSGTLILQPGTYYARLFNFNGSAVTAFTVPECRAPTVAPDPECQVKDVQSAPGNFEGLARSPSTNMYVGNKQDANGVYQVYTSPTGAGNWTCISCNQVQGGPAVDRQKMMVSWHPSGKWLVVGVEKTNHDLWFAPRAWQIGWLQSGIWLNMWLTTPTGDRWYQMTDFNWTSGPNDGFVGTPFTSDGTKAIWAEIVDGNVWVNHFGIWKLYTADFSVTADGSPTLSNKRDITPTGARWLEPGNLAPDNRHLLLSTDIGMTEAEGQDQWSLDIVSGALQNLTASPKVWDEHGLYSASGKRISFMSSYPYRNGPDTWKIMNLKTEIMLMNSDGTHLQQVTHFNVPGYPESQPSNTIAAVGQFIGDGSQMFVTVMGPDFSKLNWVVTFQGRCGSA